MLWGDARKLLSANRLAGQLRHIGGASGEEHARIDLLFLDATPKESLDYLKAAEPMLAQRALVVADNAGVFKDGGMKAYLQYVRESERYDSRFIDSHFEWRPEVPDGMEVSTYRCDS